VSRVCGISGIVAGSIEKEWIESMNTKLKHRGPDDEGYLLVNTKKKIFEERGGKDSKVPLKHVQEQVNFEIDLVFGHRRLSILDLSPAGHQPMKYEKNGDVVWIVYNGEIYNYLELREKLIKEGYEFKTNTDTEVLLASYLEWGFDCVQKFNGMWAFVIYDVGKNLLFGSRDRFGVKPLYYIHKNGYFVFASEIKAILSLPFVKRVVNERILFDYLVFGLSEHTAETFFKDVYRLEPSYNFILNLDNNKLKLERYYRLGYNDSAGVFKQRSFEAYVRKTNELVEKAIDLRLRSDVPVGTCLSGGIDSSVIATVINKLIHEKELPQIGKIQKVFSACYEEQDIDECDYAELVVENTKTEWHRTFPTSEEFLKDLENLIYIQEEPFGSTSIYAQYRVMKLAKEKGVKVLLDGQGGDELFTGYPMYYASYFIELFRNFRFLTLFRELRNLRNSPASLKDIVLFLIRRISVKFPIEIKLKLLEISQSEMRYLKKEFIKKCKGRDPSRGMVSYALNDMCHLLMTGYHLQRLLKYEDRNSMAHSIEARTPFSDDLELIEYVFSIPSVYKIHKGWSKYLLREAFKDSLPKEIRLRRDKKGFFTPEKEWISEIKEKLKRMIEFENPYIDTKALVRDFDKIIDTFSEYGFWMFWRMINALLWIKVFDLEYEKV